MVVFKNFIIVVVSGGFQTILFSPFDKAIFNCFNQKESLFTKKLWKNHYHGLSNVIVEKISQNGFYYTINNFYCKIFASYNVNNNLNDIFSGFATSLILNAIFYPLNNIKYMSWLGCQ